VPGGLEKSAEEKLRGISRLEEDALEAKVAGPIGQSPSFRKHTITHPKATASFGTAHVSINVKVPQAHAEMQHVMRVTVTA